MHDIDSQIVALVNAYYQYAQTQTQPSLSLFCQHYLAQHTEQVVAIPPVQSTPPTAHSLGGILGRVFGRLSRFVGLSLKKMIDEAGMDTVEEMWFLIAVMEIGTPTKSELIHYIIAEYSSGIAVINRLLNKSYLQETPDKADRRAKRLTLTPLGQKKIQVCFQHLAPLAEATFDILSLQEQETLYNLLHKLEKYHTQKHEEGK